MYVQDVFQQIHVKLLTELRLHTETMYIQVMIHLKR